MPADNDSPSTPRSGRRADPMAEHKRRARWRLLGAIIIVAAVGAIAPFFLEDQARPLSQDLLIEIPSRNSLFTKIDKLTPAEPSAESSADSKPDGSAQQKSSEPSAPVVSAPAATPPAPAPSPAVKSEPKPESKPESKPPAKAEPSPVAKSEPAPRAEPSPVASADPTKPSKGFLVQVGVYSKIDTAKSVQAKLTLGGHKVSVEPLVRDDGIERYRVRIGPFETREQAIEVRDRAKSQGYEAIVVNP